MKGEGMKKLAFSVMILALAALAQTAAGVDCNIYDLQYQSDPEDSNSPHVGEDVDCTGGIVIHKFFGGAPKLTLYDPAHPNGWGGIAVKDFTTAQELANTVNVGDWVSFTNTTVEESRGNTQLNYEEKSGFAIESTDNDLPQPIVIEPNDITVPLYQASPEGWLVQNHNAEKYEAMLVSVTNVIVTENGLGKAQDNYTLERYDNPGANDLCWAADYMNEEVEEDDYHRYVELDSRFCSVTGIIEQYDGYKNYYEWDYYQLITTYTGDLKRYVPADLTGDCMVDMEDLAQFSNYWLWGTE